MYDKSIESNPKDPSIYIKKWDTLYYLKRYEEAIEMYDKAIELNPEDSSVYIKKWDALYYSKRYEEAIEMYDKAIELNPKNPSVYIKKWGALKYDLNRFREGSLYAFSWEFIIRKNDWYDDRRVLDISYKKEKKIIRDYVKNKDFEWLRVYLLGLEEQ
jgi:tetratricopeptide (TPR) repeat protein